MNSQGGMPVGDGKEHRAAVPADFFASLAKLQRSKPSDSVKTPEHGVRPTPEMSAAAYDQVWIGFAKRNQEIQKAKQARTRGEVAR